MAQNLNLYDPALRRPREWVTLGSLAAAVVGVVVLLVAFGAIARWDTGRTAAAAQALDAERAVLQAGIAQVGAPVGALGELRKRLTETRAALSRKREVIDALTRGGMLRDDALSTYLAGLSRRDVDGLWLTGFVVGPGPLTMEIRGRVASTDALPGYLERLGKDTAFAGRRFASLLVERGASRRDGRPFYADFVLRAEPPAATAARETR